MPNVGGKKYSYNAAGMHAAAKARKKIKAKTARKKTKGKEIDDATRKTRSLRQYRP